jgi:hypothetical protein
VADPYDECFEKMTPCKIDTFSHQEMPCRYEEPLIPTGEEVGCPFDGSGYCRQLLTARNGEPTLQQILTSAYSERIKNVLAEPSTSVVIRSEQQFHLRDLDRFAQRRHFYEVVNNGTPGDEARFGVGCTPINEKDRFGEYLGFVDLRQHYKESALAFGLLVEPSWIREDPNTFVMGGIYGPLFGGPSFRSTVYSMQDSGTVGAACAQMCAIMALGMLADRGVEVKGSFTLTYSAWRQGREQGAARNEMELFVEGLLPEELCRVLEGCGAEPALIEIKCHEPGKEDLAARIIEANVYAAFPVILSVSGQAWRKDPYVLDAGHAVIVIGVRRDALTNGLKGFIVHDPGSGPFVPKSLYDCLDAAKKRRELLNKALEASNTIALVVAAPRSVSRHIGSCVHWLQQQDFSKDHDPYRCDGGNPEVFGTYQRREAETDYWIRLLNRNTIVRVLGPLLAGDEIIAIDACVSRLEDHRFWAIVGFRPAERGLGLVFSVAWLFDANESPESPPVAKIWRDANGSLATRPRN